jgi:pentatricopeptide repeat protein
MQQEVMSPNKFTFILVINACAALGALEDGRHVHEQIIQSGCEFDVFVGSSLVDMYAECGSIEDAQRMFNNMPSQGVVTWNALILGHVKCGQGQKALELFQQMHLEGVRLNSVTFVVVLKACASVGALRVGMHVHEQVIQSGCESNVFVGSSLVDMYAKCGSMDDANRMVNSMPSQSVVSWAAMILGHMKCRQGQDALELFEQMQQEGVQPNSVTFVAVLNACARVGAVEVGRHVHEQIIQSGCESDVFVRSSWVTCMQNVEAWRMLEECSTRCHLKIWSVGQP